MSPVQGIDVHGSKGYVDWAAVRRAGIDFAFVKASEGYSFKDERIGDNLTGARRAGIKVGAYHYARPDLHPSLEGARTEANNLCDELEMYGWDPNTDLRPVLDFEVSSGGKLDANGMCLWAEEFCAQVKRRLGVEPIFYSYTHFIKDVMRGGSPGLAKYPLWLANYGRNDGKRHYVDPGIGEWVNWTVHQYTSSGSVSGVSGRCDRNFAMTLTPLLAKTAPVKDWPIPVSKRFWPWAGWHLRGRKEQRPDSAPRRVPGWWWRRLKALVQGRNK